MDGVLRGKCFFGENHRHQMLMGETLLGAVLVFGWFQSFSGCLSESRLGTKFAGRLIAW